MFVNYILFILIDHSSVSMLYKHYCGLLCAKLYSRDQPSCCTRKHGNEVRCCFNCASPFIDRQIVRQYWQLKKNPAYWGCFKGIIMNVNCECWNVSVRSFGFTSALREERHEYPVKFLHCTQTDNTCTSVDIQFYVTNYR